MLNNEIGKIRELPFNGRFINTFWNINHDDYTTTKDENHNSINYDSEMTNRLKQRWKLLKNRRQQQDLDSLQTHE